MAKVVWATGLVLGAALFGCASPVSSEHGQAGTKPSTAKPVAPDEGTAGGQSGGETGAVEVGPVGNPTWFGLGQARAGAEPTPFEPVVALDADYSLQMYAETLYGWNDVRIWRLDSGTIVPLLELDTVHAAPQIQVVDLNADGRAEVLTFNRREATVWVETEDGFVPEALIEFEAPIGEGAAMAVEDFDRDGFGDLVVADRVGIRWFKGNADLSFEEQTTTGAVEDPRLSAQRIEVFDADDDDDLDVAVIYDFTSWAGGSEQPTGFVAVHLNGGNNTSFDVEKTELHVGRYPFAFGDINADGRTDLVWPQQNELWASTGSGSGRFGEPFLVDAPASGVGSADPMTIVDLDADGLNDVLLVRRDAVATELLNAGDGSFRRVELVGNLGQTPHVAIAPSKDGPARIYASVRVQAGNFEITSCAQDSNCTCLFEMCVGCIDTCSGSDACIGARCVACDEDSSCNETEACLGNACKRVLSSESDWQSLSINSVGAGCGIRGQGELSCWQGNNALQAPLPSGPFIQVALLNDEQFSGCALDAAGQPACWSVTGEWQPTLNEPATTLAGGHVICALLASGSIACFDEAGSHSSPAGNDFLTVSVDDERHACGLHQDGRAECWSFAPIHADAGAEESEDPEDSELGDGAALTTVPGVAFSAIAAGSKFSCGIRSEDQHVLCWGSRDGAGATPPNEAFVAVACGTGVACGLTTDGKALCWGASVRAPLGQDLVSLDVRGTYVCALKADRRFECNYEVP